MLGLFVRSLTKNTEQALLFLLRLVGRNGKINEIQTYAFRVQAWHKSVIELILDIEDVKDLARLTERKRRSNLKTEKDRGL